MSSAYLDSLTSLIKEGGSNGIGVLRFDQHEPMWSGRSAGFRGWNALSIAGIPRFIDLEDVDSVYRMVSDLRERARTAKPSS